VSFARFSLLLVALFVSAFSLALSRSRADELPADTNTIKSLTPEQARKQARKLVTLSVEQARQLVERKSGYILSIDGLKSLDVDVAKVLARSQNNWLFLNGLKTIDAETAKSLAGYKGHLGLNDVISLDVDTIRALAEVERAGLFFDGMPTIDTEAAEAISRFRGGLLRLDGLTALDADTASVVARTKANTLALNKLRTIDPETAKSLLQFRGVFHFTALHETVGQETPLSVDVAKTRLPGRKQGAICRVSARYHRLRLSRLHRHRSIACKAPRPARTPEPQENLPQDAHGPDREARR
jgi:hypothetical protein